MASFFTYRRHERSRLRVGRWTDPGEPQADEAAEQATEKIANPADLQGKPRSITPTLKLMQCVI